MADGIAFNPEGAVHTKPKKPRNRGQETMPWEEIETIANATVFIKGKSHAGTGTLIFHQGRMWLLTANSVLKPSEAPLDDLLLYFGYINKDKQGAYLSAKDLLDTKEWHSHPVHHLNYTMVAVHEDKLRDKLQKKMPLPVYWEFTHEAEDLQRLDHLYTVHYPDPEGKGEHRRSFGGDVIQGTQGAFIFCAMSAWDGSKGAPLFKTAEKSGKPELVGIFNYFEQGKLKRLNEDECVTNVGCNISHIKKHVHSEVWSKIDTPETIRVKSLSTCSD